MDNNTTRGIPPPQLTERELRILKWLANLWFFRREKDREQFELDNEDIIAWKKIWFPIRWLITIADLGLDVVVKFVLPVILIFILAYILIPESWYLENIVHKMLGDASGKAYEFCDEHAEIPWCEDVVEYVFGDESTRPQAAPYNPPQKAKQIWLVMKFTAKNGIMEFLYYTPFFERPPNELSGEEVDEFGNPLEDTLALYAISVAKEHEAPPELILSLCQQASGLEHFDPDTGEVKEKMRIGGAGVGPTVVSSFDIGLCGINSYDKTEYSQQARGSWHENFQAAWSILDQCYSDKKKDHAKAVACYTNLGKDSPTVVEVVEGATVWKEIMVDVKQHEVVEGPPIWDGSVPLRKVPDGYVVASIWNPIWEAVQDEGGTVVEAMWLYSTRDHETPGAPSGDCKKHRSDPMGTICHSYVGAKGPFQFMNGTWSLYAEDDWDRWDLYDSARAAYRMQKELKLFSQPDKKSYQTRFSGKDDGLCWNCGDVGYGQAGRIWDDAQKLINAAKSVQRDPEALPSGVLFGKPSVFSIKAQASWLGSSTLQNKCKSNFLSFFSRVSEGNPDPTKDFKGSVTIQPGKTLYINQHFGFDNFLRLPKVINLPGDCVCNSASVLDQAAANAGLETGATDRRHAPVAGVSANHLVVICDGCSPNKGSWIKNIFDHPVTIHWVANHDNDTFSIFVSNP